MTGWAPGVNPGRSGNPRRCTFRENYDLGVRISISIFFYCLNLASRAQFRQYRVSWPSCGPDQHTAVLVWPTGLPAIVRRADWVGGTHGTARATTLASRECQGSARRLSVPGSRPDEFGVSIERHSPRLESHQAVLPSDSLDAGTGSRQTAPDTSPCQGICLRVSGQIDRFWFGRGSDILVSLTDQKRGAKVPTSLM